LPSLLPPIGQIMPQPSNPSQPLPPPPPDLVNRPPLWWWGPVISPSPGPVGHKWPVDFHTTPPIIDRRRIRPQPRMRIGPPSPPFYTTPVEPPQVQPPDVMQSMATAWGR